MKVAEQSGIDGERGNKKCRREKKMNENENGAKFRRQKGTCLSSE